MFELSKKEYENLRSQFATSSWGGTRYAPMENTVIGKMIAKHKSIDDPSDNNVPFDKKLII